MSPEIFTLCPLQEKFADSGPYPLAPLSFQCHAGRDIAGFQLRLESPREPHPEVT